jgi:hypothetical protein
MLVAHTLRLRVAFAGAGSGTGTAGMSWPGVCRMSSGMDTPLSASTPSKTPCGEDAGHFTAHALRLFTWVNREGLFLNADRPAAGDARASMKSAGVRTDTTDDDSRGASQYRQISAFQRRGAVNLAGSPPSSPSAQFTVVRDA